VWEDTERTWDDAERAWDDRENTWDDSARVRAESEMRGQRRPKAGELTVADFCGHVTGTRSSIFELILEPLRSSGF
jgi:hypothetical protein